MCRVHSIGIRKIAGIAMKIDTALRNSVANATARGANAGVWNSLTLFIIRCIPFLLCIYFVYYSLPDVRICSGLRSSQPNVLIFGKINRWEERTVLSRDSFCTYIAPARNRNTMSNRKSIKNADTNEKNDPNRAAIDKTFWRPQTSVANPLHREIRR